MLRLGLLRPLYRLPYSTPSCCNFITQVQRPLTTRFTTSHRPQPSNHTNIPFSPHSRTMMHSSMEGDWSLEDILKPDFRTVNFSDGPAQMLVATQLRHAWGYDGPSTGSDVVGVFMKENHERTPEQIAALPQYPDKEAVHTPWRDEVYHTWNHVFHDVMEFLVALNGTMGHFHPPNHDAFALNFPPSDGQETENTRVLTKTWDTGVLLIPAHLEPGVVVRMETFSQREEDGEVKDVVKMRGKFSEDKIGEIWYLRKGVEARFFIEGEWDKNSKGLAAVMVNAILCNVKNCKGSDS